MSHLDFFSDDKLLFLRYLIKENQIKNSDGLGRTAIMKLIFLLQEGKGLPVGYDFRLYSYGPYDSEVLQDLEFLRNFGFLTEETVHEERYQWKKYYPSESKSEIDENSSLLNGNKGEIDNLIEKYGNKKSRELELFATTLFVMKEKRGCDTDADSIKKIVSEIKPKYNEVEINQAYSTMIAEFSAVCN